MAASNTHSYVGSPGYEFRLTSGVVDLTPGALVALTDDEAEMYGDQFAPIKPKKTTDAPASNPEGDQP